MARAPEQQDNVTGARRLRRVQTRSEEMLWELLRDRRLAGWKFRRQHPVGPLVLDFYCVEAKLAVELDGAPHRELAGRQRDLARDEIMTARGIRTVRIWSSTVERDMAAVASSIQAALKDRAPLPGAGEGLG